MDAQEDIHPDVDRILSIAMEIAPHLVGEITEERRREMSKTFYRQDAGFAPLQEAIARSTRLTAEDYNVRINVRD